MNLFFFISIAYFLGKYVNRIFMSDNLDQPVIDKQKYKDVKYYSNNVQLNQPFQLEYRFILNVIEREKEYEMKYRKILIEYPNEPIFDVEVQSPIFRAYSYTYNHVYLAKSYLEIRKEYLENLS